MITTEFKTSAAIIRIHDEYFETTVDACICRLSRIVSESYKRRQMRFETNETAPISGSITTVEGT